MSDLIDIRITGHGLMKNLILHYCKYYDEQTTDIHMVLMKVLPKKKEKQLRIGTHDDEIK